jgi:hypothetical protein
MLKRGTLESSRFELTTTPNENEKFFSQRNALRRQVRDLRGSQTHLQLRLSCITLSGLVRETSLQDRVRVRTAMSNWRACIGRNAAPPDACIGIMEFVGDIIRGTDSGKLQLFSPSLELC